MAALSRPMYIAQMQDLARARGGRCLSTEYVNSATPLEWECAEGHQWMATPNNVGRGTWCPVCGRARQGGNAYSITIETLRELARTRGGECLENEYLGVFAKHRWRCSEGHEWEAISDSVRRGSWCPVCSTRAHALSIDLVRQFAAKRGWKCLSDDYETNQTKLEWECERGHRWTATYNVIQATDGCPHCREEERRAAGLAKCQAVAAERGGRCLATEFRGVHYYMEWECSEGHRWTARPSPVLEGSWCRKCNTLKRRTKIEEMQDLAARRGGVCLSAEYVGNHVKLRWRCAEGHEWVTTPGSIKSGSWCPKCASRDRRPHTIEEARTTAAEHGGMCLSPAYKNNKTPLLWQCDRGHQWWAQYRRVCKGSWCPSCDALRRAESLTSAPRGPRPAGSVQVRRRTLTQMIEEVLQIVEERGGRCLTRDIANRNTKLQLQCSHGHAWQAPVASILDGHWCHACGRASMEAAYRKRFGLLALDDQDEVALWAESQGLDYVQQEKPLVGRQDFFRCAQAHLWEVSRTYSSLGSWCPVCGTRGDAMGVGREVR